MSTNLFSDFAGSDKESWKRLVASELKGKLPEATSWPVAEDLFFDPYYTTEEIDQQNALQLQQSQRKTTGWLNTPLVYFDSPASTNLNIHTALSSGADAIFLDLGNREIASCELIKTLHAVRLTDSFIYFKTNADPLQLYAEISRGAGYNLKGGIANDPIAEWMRSGLAVDELIARIGRVLLQTKPMKDFRPFMIESHIYHEAGADPVQELAFMISALVTCVDHLTDSGFSALHALNRFFFSVSVGPHYLAETAKLRALRFLYRKITRAYQLPDELCNPFIHAKTSSLYHAKSASYSNMIRSVCEAISAVTGGCDALTVERYQQSDPEIADRIARNVSLLLKHESHLDYVADPASGSYLIDNMSLGLAESAWKLFLEMENSGGFISCFNSGFIHRKVEKSWQTNLKLSQVEFTGNRTALRSLNI